MGNDKLQWLSKECVKIVDASIAELMLIHCCMNTIYIYIIVMFSYIIADNCTNNRRTIVVTIVKRFP